MGALSAEIALKGAAAQLDSVVLAMPPRDLTPPAARVGAARRAPLRGALMLLSSPEKVARPAYGLTLPSPRAALASPTTPLGCDPMRPPIPEAPDRPAVSAGLAVPAVPAVPAAAAQAEARSQSR